MLTLPWGAPADQPALVIGPDVPDLIAVDPYGRAVVSAIIWRSGLTVRYFQALAGDDFGHTLWYGAWDETDAVNANDVIWHTAVAGATSGSAPFKFNITEQFGSFKGTGHVATYEFDKTSDVNVYGGFNVFTSTTNALFGEPTFDYTPMARGIRNAVSLTSNSAVVGTTETAVLTTPYPFDFTPGRAYAVYVAGRFNCTAVSYVTTRVRKNTAAGAIVCDIGAFYSPTVGPILPMDGRFVVGNFTGFPITLALAQTIVCTGANTAVHVGNSTRPRSIEIHDVGTTDYFPNAIPL